jgi:hypothetical protein
MSENGFSEAQKKALMKLPGFKDIKKAYGQAGMGKKKMRGGSFWSDLWDGIKSTAKSVDTWLTRTKALSTAAKVIGAISAVIPGLQGVAPIAAAAATGATALGYGRRKGGKRIDARSFGSHVNPVAGSRGLVSVGMGSMVQNFQSPGLRMMNGGATFPSHLQPFLKKGRSKGFGVSQAIGSIGNPGKIKM